MRDRQYRRTAKHTRARLGSGLNCSSTDYDAWRKGKEVVTVAAVMKVLKTNAELSKHITAQILAAVHDAVALKQVGASAEKGMQYSLMSRPPQGSRPEELYKLKYLLPAYFGQYEDPVRARSTSRPRTQDVDDSQGTYGVPLAKVQG
ncbi:hypothetical protein JCM6882_006843 [Rhodosporidiobolus microsporus]